MAVCSTVAARGWRFSKSSTILFRMIDDELIYRREETWNKNRTGLGTMA
jgi:hypothetical protein